MCIYIYLRNSHIEEAFKELIPVVSRKITNVTFNQIGLFDLNWRDMSIDNKVLKMDINRREVSMNRESKGILPMLFIFLGLNIDSHTSVKKLNSMFKIEM